jgi:hypothetical protein
MLLGREQESANYSLTIVFLRKYASRSRVHPAMVLCEIVAGIAELFY